MSCMHALPSFLVHWYVLLCILSSRFVVSFSRFAQYISSGSTVSADSSDSSSSSAGSTEMNERFILSRIEPRGVPALSRRHFESWAHHHGVPLDGSYLPWLQLGPIPWKTYPFLGMSCRAYSLLRKKALVATRRDELIPGMPVWHSVWFRDTHNNTYYSPAMIRKGIHTVSQMDSQAGGGGGAPPHVGTTVPDRAGPAPRTAKAATLRPPTRHPVILASMEPAAHAALPHEVVPRGPPTATRGVESMAQAAPTPSRHAVQTDSVAEEIDGRSPTR